MISILENTKNSIKDTNILQVKLFMDLTQLLIMETKTTEYYLQQYLQVEAHEIDNETGVLQFHNPALLRGTTYDKYLGVPRPGSLDQPVKIYYKFCSSMDFCKFDNKRKSQIYSLIVKNKY